MLLLDIAMSEVERKPDRRLLVHIHNCCKLHAYATVEVSCALLALASYLSLGNRCRRYHYRY